MAAAKPDDCELLGVPRDADEHEALPEARAPAPRGESVRAQVELRAFEASQGASRVVRYEALQVCEACGGRGTEYPVNPDCLDCGGAGCPSCMGGPCERCEGFGRRRAQRTLNVRIPAGVKNDTRLRVAGGGDAGAPGRAPGDLLLDVSVLPPPRDYHVVRYAALALFVVAVVLLVSYLLLR